MSEYKKMYKALVDTYTVIIDCHYEQPYTSTILK